jgi:hypothetical protein
MPVATTSTSINISGSCVYEFEVAEFDMREWPSDIDEGGMKRRKKDRFYEIQNDRLCI